jgi:hypothetical protein
MGVSTYDLHPLTLFLSLLVTTRTVIVRTGGVPLNQNVTAPIAAVITIVAMGVFMTKRSEFRIRHINHHGSRSTFFVYSWLPSHT